MLDVLIADLNLFFLNTNVLEPPLMNADKVLTAYDQFGIYGLITYLEKNNNSEISPRVTAYNLLKAGRIIAKKSIDERLSYLPDIAFGLSRHDSIYRMAALLYIELGDMNKALECLSYLYHYYAEQSIAPHEHYAIIEKQLVERFKDIAEIQRWIADNYESYKYQRALNNIKEYSEIMPTEDVSKQKKYFINIYRRYGINTLITALENDIRFNERAKAVLLIRASRAIGSIAEEGTSIESLFADKAIALDNSDTVVKNSYHAYMRAGDLNKLTQLKEKYPQLVAG